MDMDLNILRVNLKIKKLKNKFKYDIKTIINKVEQKQIKHKTRNCCCHFSFNVLHIIFS